MSAKFRRIEGDQTYHSLFSKLLDSFDRTRCPLLEGHAMNLSCLKSVFRPMPTSFGPKGTSQN
jgi:hypothetical protein